MGHDRAAEGHQRLKYEVTGRIAHITLDRPERLNALDRTAVAELRRAFHDLDADPEVWVAILSGNGRAFSSGADAGMVGVREPTGSSPDMYFLNNPVNWKPVIAAVHGYCYGHALSLAAECDLIVATEDATFCLIETKIGMPPVTIFAHLAAWMGSKRLTEMILTGEPLSAAEAHRLGLVNGVVKTRDELLPAAEELAQRIASNPPQAVRDAVQLSRTSALTSQLHHAAESVYRNSNWRRSEDFREAVDARREKRRPVFTGR